ncbi:uncharacterized protein LOC120351704 isoform X1 [Nilaparvata lugens]|uniref:uncharacterized protein LOC120351704 isoform X1 n=1 Tax=Nilaparvata lugens TaxID=108931 RepID=UPI00193EA7CA|nr:uncharacterized protein LOC120351704 isoform X1 [Nilaparvata lugens]
MSETPDRTFLQRKQDLKNALRQEYWKKITEPIDRHPGAYLMDPGLQRYTAVQPTRYQYFKPTLYSGVMYICVMVIPFAGTMWYFKTSRDAREKAIRTGQVAYADRPCKFV